MIKETNIKVLETTDYSMFKYANWNRKISNVKVNQLAESMSELGYVGSPIVVNESYVVIDGQHRAKACERINIPVQYIIRYGSGAKECRRLNMTQQNWTTKMLVESFAKEYEDDKENPYVLLNNLVNEYGQPLRTTLCAIKGYWSGDPIIRSGLFVMKPYEYEQAKKVLDFLILVEPYKKYFNRDGWLYALCSLYKYELIDAERMLTQLEKYGNTLENVTSTKEAVQALNQLYNYQLHQKVRFVDKWLDLNDER